MNLSKSIILFSITFSVASCGGNTSHTHEGGSSHTATTATSVKDTINPYICPMLCENSGSQKAGLCPVCEMDLGTNPNFPDAETLPVGEEPLNGKTFEDTLEVAGIDTPEIDTN